MSGSDPKLLEAVFVPGINDAGSAAPTDVDPAYSASIESEEVDWNGELSSLFSAVPPASTPADSPEASIDTSAPAATFDPQDEIGLLLPHKLSESLARLELNSLQLRIYLDSIEEKISRLEPRLEQMRDSQSSHALPPDISLPPSVPFHVSPLAPVCAPGPPAVTTTERRRRRQDLPLPFGERRSTPFIGVDFVLEQDPWSWQPWLRSHRVKLAVAGTVLLAFVLVITFFGAGTGAKSPTAASVATRLPSSTPALGSLAQTSKASVAIAFPAIASSASAITLPRSVSVDPTSTASTTASAEASSQPVTGAPRSSLTSSSNTHIAASVPTLTPHAASVTARVHLSSGVMAGNLVSSRPPKYPGGFASLFHTQGTVTMQAVISRSGRVEDLRVLSGHRLLRGAAQDAVRTWRYRPYAINGIPVEVATIITVDFER